MLNDMYRTLPFDMEFSTYARLDLILSKPETLPQLMESGMRSVFFGIETLNHASGKAVGKGMNPERIKRGLEDIKREYPELFVCTGFISGLPHETKDTLRTTIDWLRDSPVDSFSFQVLSLGKGSVFGKTPEGFGYTVDDNGQWSNEHMTQKEALGFAEEAASYTTSISGFTFYNRLRNLGYTPDQIRDLSIADQVDIKARTKVRKDAYRARVL